MLVRIVKDWSYPDVTRQFKDNTLSWEGIDFTFDPVEHCDYLISLNPPKEKTIVNCPRGNRWLVLQEPPIKAYNWHTKSIAHFDRVFSQWPNTTHSDAVMTSTQTAIPWHVNLNFSTLQALQPQHKATNAVSSITSINHSFPGHKLRWRLLEHLAQENFHVDLFGKGFNYIEDKYDALAPFRYSIAIENSFFPHYWSEKIVDCFLSWTMPIYCGAPNITDYFPADSMILIDPNDPSESRKIICDAIQSKKWERNLDAISESRNRVLNHYQLFPWIKKQIDQSGQLADAPLDNAPIEPNPRPRKSQLARLLFRAQRRAGLKKVQGLKAYKDAVSLSRPL